MKTTILDKLAVSAVLTTALMTVGAWGFAWQAQRRLSYMQRTVFMQPCEHFEGALAAGEAADASTDDSAIAIQK